MAYLADTTNRACFVAGDLSPRPFGPPADPGRAVYRAGQAPHAWDGREHVRSACTLGYRAWTCALHGRVAPHGCSDVLSSSLGPERPGIFSTVIVASPRPMAVRRRHWTTLDLALRAPNMSHFVVLKGICLGVKHPNAHTVSCGCG
eukprot:4854285-Prymnesium_polylepis.1